jgi:predicted Zn-dependent peptidase
VEDTPDDLVHDLFAEAIWGDHPVARPILGQKEIVLRLSQSDIRRHMDRFYRPDCTVIAAAGDIEHDQLMDLVVRAFDGFDGQSIHFDPPAPVSTAAMRVEERDTAQLHLCLGMDGLPHAHEDRYAISLLNAMLGGSMSSRLFQEVREKRGLAYSIYSYQASYRDCGLLVVYAGTSPESSNQVVDLIRAECARLRDEPVDPIDLQQAKDQLKGNLLLGLEGTSSRMTRLAKMEIYFQRNHELDEIIAGSKGSPPISSRRWLSGSCGTRHSPSPPLVPFLRLPCSPDGRPADPLPSTELRTGPVVSMGCLRHQVTGAIGVCQEDER